MRSLALPSAQRAALDRRVRATDRLNRQAAGHKTRIRDLPRQPLALSPLTGDLGAAGLAALERYADPRALARAGESGLTALIAKASHGQQGAQRARQWLDAASTSLELYAGHPCVDFTGLAAGVASEIRLLRATCAELPTHAAQREACYQAMDPAALARCLPGIAEVGGRALTACMGNSGPLRPRQAVPLLHWPDPNASETGETNRKGQLPHVHAFTRGLDLDTQAVTAALTMPFHNGRTEGVNF